MSWRSSLQKASFRDRRFWVLDSSTSVGRRNVLHEYPFRDEAYIEDLGLKADTFTINGYVIANKDNSQNYFRERDELIEALKEEGPGTLIHPFLGSKQVSLVGQAEINEKFSEGGIARFTMTFTVTEKSSFVAKPSLDSKEAVDSAAEDSNDLSKDGFGSVYSGELSSPIPNYIVDSTQEVLDILNRMLKSVTKIVQGAGPAQSSQAIIYQEEQYDLIEDDTIYVPCDLVEYITGMFNGLASLSGLYGELRLNYIYGVCSGAIRGISSGPMSGAFVETPSTGFMTSTTATPEKIDETFGKTLINALLEMNKFGEHQGGADLSLYGGEIKEINITSKAKARQAANQAAIVTLVRNTAIILAMRVAVRISHSSYDAVTNIQNQIVDALEKQLIKIGADAGNSDYGVYGIPIADEDSYTALQTLRPVFVQSMNEIGKALARVVSYTVPPAVIPSIVLAYNKYEDLDREREIIDRNLPSLYHPGFLPSGDVIEILSE